MFVAIIAALATLIKIVQVGHTSLFLAPIAVVVVVIDL